MGELGTGVSIPKCLQTGPIPTSGHPWHHQVLTTLAILWSEVDCIPSQFPCIGSSSHAKFSQQKLCTSTIPHLLDPQSFLLPLPVLRWSRVQWARTSCWDSKKLTFLIPQLVMLRVYFPLALLCRPFHGSEGDWQPPEQKCFHYQ